MINLDNKDLSRVVEEVVRGVLGENETSFLNLKSAKKLAEKIEEEAVRLGVKAVVAVADKGGNPILAECMDGAYIASYDIALNKAFTSVSLKMSTAQLCGLAQPGAPLYGIDRTNGGRLVIFGGGEPLKINGEIVGGLGVSGGSAAQDTYLAQFGREIFEKYTVR